MSIKMRDIGIINYEVGNLRNIQKAFEFNGIDAVISSDLQELSQCSKLILPGVGAFAACKEKLDKAFGDEIMPLILTKPTLGICIGMQLLFDYSLEFGRTDGLGIVEGYVDKLLSKDLPIPHAGWNKIKKQKKHFLFENIEDQSFFYFTHSYKCNLVNSDNSLALCNYENDFCCSVEKEGIYGVQFHPEKSGEAGLQLLKNFHIGE